MHNKSSTSIIKKNCACVKEDYTVLKKYFPLESIAVQNKIINRQLLSLQFNKNKNIKILLNSIIGNIFPRILTHGQSLLNLWIHISKNFLTGSIIGDIFLRNIFHRVNHWRHISKNFNTWSII